MEQAADHPARTPDSGFIDGSSLEAPLGHEPDVCPAQPMSPSSMHGVGNAKDRIFEERLGEAPRDHTSSSTFTDESRYTKDEHGNLVYKWLVNYAARGGNGCATCRDTDCLERHDQGGVSTIEKGCLRIGRRVLVEREQDARMTTLWYHARCMFNVFLRSKKTTRVVQTPEDLEGFASIKFEDQEMLRRFISCHQDVRNAHLRAAGSQTTPSERNGIPYQEETSAPKRRKTDPKSMRELTVGERVWTHFRAKSAEVSEASLPPGPVEIAIKSKKPELGMIREEEKDGCVVIQFESQAHEQERLQMYSLRKFQKIRGWLRYPRIFEGKKQRIPLNWIQWQRAPPRMCGCVKQEWNHSCDCGISCPRSSRPTVWGVCQ